MSRVASILLLVPVLALAVTVAATTIHVPDEQPTIQAGIDRASAGDTVLVACGTYYEHDVTMKSGVYLTSETGLADCVTIDAQQQARVFYCDGVDATASIVGFTITGGLATGSDLDNLGAGMLCWHSSPTLTDCTFDGNQADDGGGGISCDLYSHPTLTDCTFSENQADFGGGMFCFDSSCPTLTGCTFVGNEAASGGGMFCCGSSPTLTGCTFFGNQADFYGGGVGCFISSPTLTTCIIAFSQRGEAVYCGDIGSTPELSCCDVYGNAGGDWVGCIEDQYGVNGNFSGDPLFCGEENPEQPYTLHSDSPCASEHNPGCGLIGAWDVGCGSPVEATSWGSIKAMFR